MRVCRLPKILDTDEATRLLEVEGFDAAEEYLSKHDPREQELYLVLERARVRLQEMSVSELVQAHNSPERLAILKSLQDQLGVFLQTSNDLLRPTKRRHLLGADREHGDCFVRFSASMASPLGRAADDGGRLSAWRV